MAAAQDTQKEQSDRQGRKNTQVFKLGDQVLLNAKKLPTQAVSAVSSTKLRPRFVGPFTVIGVHGHAYTLDLPSFMATHPTFYVGLLKPYRPVGAVEPEEPTGSQSTAGRRSPSSERALPREAGQGQAQEPDPELDQEHEPLRGEPLALAYPLVVLLALRTAGLQAFDIATNLPRQIPDVIPQAVQVLSDILELLQAGLRILDASAKRHAPPSRSADHPAVADKTPPRREGSSGQDGSQSNDAERLGRTPLPPRAPPPLLGNEGVLYYHVERLLKRRGRSGQYQYLVKWWGYSSSHNSWEPGARLAEDCADLVAAIERAHGPGRR
ncbi:hypothetical protein PF002_g24416 [Phytophthora fragariae]|uniref:Chromo domain-containing protein n=1 Tax=Phytophthora fragariae TaxID=53985 RepID=A0A6A3X3Q6_9STRA|nr:hypothetical protein PF002_g24416 [Phytophthora fragariae]